jgi:hypothetical protein
MGLCGYAISRIIGADWSTKAIVACAARSPNSAFVTDAVINRASVVEWNIHFIDCFNKADIQAERQFDIRAIPIPSLI